MKKDASHLNHTLPPGCATIPLLLGALADSALGAGARCSWWWQLPQCHWVPSRACIFYSDFSVHGSHARHSILCAFFSLSSVSMCCRLRQRVYGERVPGTWDGDVRNMHVDLSIPYKATYEKTGSSSAGEHTPSNEPYTPSHRTGPFLCGKILARGVCVPVCGFPFNGDDFLPGKLLLLPLLNGAAAGE